ncbi:penicillin-insensitive murein endopeptidase [Notoacmeibacter sp. MSK16QG-6]|uniref:penicillin-insensitive murein endopeptidase n=1 Tax=Notoacmeibacter sp. MSK16QG-6 TaxID=2957982 RepID=UPI00209EAF82|nr:penicillin-insensitive murein endopeptidase [Notoacmeibacter sp. MSK16QG-6]MCP1198951.1 penicillin-insensitive murein endopeptidase [Notoacmeibacter sp. MSK16QG-6]
MIRLFFGVLAALAFLAQPVSAASLAKNLFGAEDLPADMSPATYGFYSKGCFAGGVGLSLDGPNWQVMRPSRNRRWGHPAMIGLLQKLSRDAAKDGWPGLLVGDISQPRGGPMLTGHASHQVGLDADIWLTPMPDRRLTRDERENLSATDMLVVGAREPRPINDKVWTAGQAAVIKRAASYPEVQRILVHPSIKKKLCETAGRDRAWLNKVRPFWGHNYHFHVRLRCQPGSPQCRPQKGTGRGDGCGEAMGWWFTRQPWLPPKPGVKPKPKARDVMTMAALPKACRAVLAAQPKSPGDAIFSATTAAALAMPIPPLPKRRPDR